MSTVYGCVRGQQAMAGRASHWGYCHQEPLFPPIFFLFYLLNHQFIVKGYNSDTTRWKGYIGQGMWKRAQSFPGLRHSTLPTSPRVHQSGSSLLFLPEKLLIPQYSQHRWAALCSSPQTPLCTGLRTLVFLPLLIPLCVCFSRHSITGQEICDKF